MTILTPISAKCKDFSYPMLTKNMTIKANLFVTYYVDHTEALRYNSWKIREELRHGKDKTYSSEY